MRRLTALLVLCLLAGCGGSGEEAGTARLWVTSDRGQELVLEAEVPAGQTLMRALASELDVETRYGGRFLQSAAGLEGSVDGRRDWFWFVNGYEGDRSAAEYRLRDGDVAWWDFRSWEREGEARVVVGAFPEPFVHGFNGDVRPAAVRYAPTEKARAEELASEVGAESIAPLETPVPAGTQRAGGAARRAVHACRAHRRDGRRPGARRHHRLARRADAAVRAAVTRQRLSPGPAAALLAAAGFAALLADRLLTVGTIAVVLLVVCLRAPAERRGVYLFGALATGLGVFIVSPFLWSSPEGTVLWEGPTIPVVGPLDVTTDELYEAALNALRLTALALAFSAYALLLDHDRLVASVGFARRSALAVALATRLVPSLERDAAGLAESVRGRGVAVRRSPGPRRVAVAARRRLARAGDEPGGGDGGTRLRAAWLHACTAACVDRMGPTASSSRRCSSCWWRSRGSSERLRAVVRVSRAAGWPSTASRSRSSRVR